MILTTGLFLTSLVGLNFWICESGLPVAIGSKLFFSPWKMHFGHKKEIASQAFKVLFSVASIFHYNNDYNIMQSSVIIYEPIKGIKGVVLQVVAYFIYRPLLFSTSPLFIPPRRYYPMQWRYYYPMWLR